MANVEVLRLGEFDTELNRREFDAISFGRFYWQGLLSFEQWPEEGRIYVFSDRADLLGDDYGMRPGKVEEVRDTKLARAVITKAVEECFDHSITVEVLPDGNSGWITFETDT